MFQVEANSKQIPWLHSPILYNYGKYNSLVDGLVLFALGNDDLPAHCQISSVWSSFISTLTDLLIALFVETLHTSMVAHALHIWVHLKSKAAVSSLRKQLSITASSLIYFVLWVVESQRGYLCKESEGMGLMLTRVNQSQAVIHLTLEASSGKRKSWLSE